MEPVYLSIQQEATGKRMRQLIREKGYSVRDIQEAMGFESPQAVYKWLSGKCLPNLDNFLILSRILHTSMEDILVVDGDIAVFRNEVRQMKSVWNREDFYWARIDGKLPGMIRMLCKDLKYCRQRITRGYSDRDVRNIQKWFMDVVPDMLQQFRDTSRSSPGILGENYTNEQGILANDTCHEEWNRILTEMLRLFREADEHTCQKKNPYGEEHSAMWSEFSERFGLIGEKLRTEEEKKDPRWIRAHFPSEIPEYQELDRLYWEEEKKLETYRDECKDKAFEMFSKWFWHLWD
ncbi:helix-turn-helix domain-containing protein [Lacrimispora sp. 210928-DFI.3.58]|uniref:helix-turn-helix domain-containing protein n=1 Tax=Lacrimispora sp. 210928-DFI.3.58 TaxID=2883214 RepID=UPI001D072D84|nr:helix-turn-helix transcriptional regulator [Lacrimispora sp. 210928-DFI.3.58]MCB7319912.1 helix-turn-helix transcriptional regulator [Lacrimispora sp. 210928-DFI.3.58]